LTWNFFNLKVFFSFFGVCVCAVLEVKLRASHLLSMRSITWACLQPFFFG
jgi:hypothetical protein